MRHDHVFNEDTGPPEEPETLSAATTRNPELWTNHALQHHYESTGNTVYLNILKVRAENDPEARCIVRVLAIMVQNAERSHVTENKTDNEE